MADAIKNLELRNEELRPAILTGLEHVAALHSLQLNRAAADQASLSDAFLSSLGSVNKLLAVAGAVCRIGAPPVADIQIVTDISGRLIRRCTHPAAHKWDMNGSPI